MKCCDINCNGNLEMVAEPDRNNRLCSTCNKY